MFLLALVKQGGADAAYAAAVARRRWVAALCAGGQFQPLFGFAAGIKTMLGTARELERKAEKAEKDERD